ncbi:MAG: recombinase family protein, partial [Clostridiales bacterium]|nr:recombinase family protein [Clostridiales bacterium]
SENVTWGQRKRMADGKVSLAYSRFLGYDKAADGSMVINEEQAKAIRLIYKLFLEGYSPYSIAQNLTRQGILTPAGKSRWCQSTVKSILTNEKYKGDALLQKYFTESFLTHKAKKNEGQLQQYYVKDNHEAIISPELFDMVQIEIKKRNKQGGRYSGTGLFSNKLKCGDCGNWYGSKVWQSNTKYRKAIFQCNHKFKNKCQTPNLTEEKIKEFFLRAINQLIENKNEILENMETVLAVVCNTSELEAEQLDFQNELDFLVSSIESCIAENARNVQNQDEYNQKYDSLVKKYNDVKEKYENTSAILKKQNQKIYEVKFFINTLKKQNALINEFDNGLWDILLDYGTVNRNGSITFTFKNDIEITVD